MAATIFPAPSAAQLTDQGGTVVLARFKTGDVAINSTQLPAGSYYLTMQGSGDIDIFPYTGSQLGARIRRVAISGSTTVQITVPSGVSGLAFSGSYDGPLVFQTIASASSVIFGATQIQLDATYLDFTSYDWKPIAGSPFFITWSAGYSTIVNMDTGTTVTTAVGGTRPVRASDNAFITANNFSTLYAYNPSTGTIVFANGYGQGSNNSRIYRTTDQGLTWSTPQTNLQNNMAYWNNAQYEGSNFYVTAGWTGSSIGVRLIYVSSNDGANWSLLDLTSFYMNSSNTPLSRIAYSPTANRYIALPLPNNTNPSSGYDTVWNLGSSGTSYVAMYQVAPYGNGWTQGGYIPANDVHSGRFILIDSLGHSKRSDDGITWVADAPSAYGTSFVTRFNEGYEGYVQSIVGATTYGGNAIRFGALRNDQSTGSNDIILFDGNGNRTGLSVGWNSPFSSSNPANRIAQASNSPANSRRRIVLARPGDSVRPHRISEEAVNAALTSPSGFSTGYATDLNSRTYYSTRYDLAVLQGSDNNLYTNFSKKPQVVPSNRIWTNTQTKDTVETSGGTIFVLSANGETLRSTDGINWVNGPNLTITNIGAGNHLGVLGNTILCSRGSNSQVYVSLDQGVSFFAITMPSTGTGTDTAWRITSNGTLFIAIANASNQVWRSTDGMSWTYTGATSPVNSYPWRAGDICFGPAISGNTTLYRFTPGGAAVVSYTNPNSSFDNSIVQFGSEYAMVPFGQTTTTFYTSANGSSWTARSILTNRVWQTALGSPSFAIAFSGATSLAEKFISTRTVTVV